jgi:hypothetical protein
LRRDLGYIAMSRRHSANFSARPRFASKP